jgi:cobalamin biosynthesis protein CobD/CbiB
MPERLAVETRRSGARITGVVYLLYFLTAVFSQLFARGDHAVLYKSISIIAEIFYLALTIRFYFLFKPVSTVISLLAALFGFMGCANDLLRIFGIAPYKINPLVFFGPYCVLIGYLILRSNFLPRVFGVLLVVAGVGWLTFLSPLATHLSTFLKVLGFLAEVFLMLWLVVKGVNEQRRQEQAGAAGTQASD